MISGEDLKRENRDLREENECLKDKVAYLEALYETSTKEKAEQAQKKRFSAILTAVNEKGRKNIRRLCAIAGISPKCFHVHKKGDTTGRQRPAYGRPRKALTTPWDTVL